MEEHAGGENQGLTHAKHSFSHWAIVPATCQLQNVFQVLVKEIQSLMKRNFQNEANLGILYQLATFWPDFHENHNGYDPDL